MYFGKEVFHILDSAKTNKWDEVAAQDFITAGIMIKILVTMTLLIQIPFIYMAHTLELRNFYIYVVDVTIFWFRDGY